MLDDKGLEGLTYQSQWVSEWFYLVVFLQQQGPCSPYKLHNHNLYIGIIIFLHTDSTESHLRKRELQNNDKNWESHTAITTQPEESKKKG